MDWFTGISFGCLGVSLTSSIAMTLWFTYLSIYDFTFMPCNLNFYRSQYKYFVGTAFLHALVIGIVSLLQVYAAYYDPVLSFHMNGSVQIASLVPTIFHVHFTANMYKYRSLHMTNSCQMYYERSFIVIVLSFILSIFLAIYAVFVFCIEREWLEIHRNRLVDENMKYYHTGEVILYVFIGMIVCMVLYQLYRICKRWIQINKICWDVTDDPDYYFRHQISSYNLSYFINDMVFAFLPYLYLVLRADATQVLNKYDVLAKFLLTSHTTSFIALYMWKIRTAKKLCGDQDFRCMCFRCTPSSKSPLLNCWTSTCILQIIDSYFPCRNNRRNREEERRRQEQRMWLEMEEIGGAAATAATDANAHEHPTETTPETNTSQIGVSEDV